MNTRRDKTLGLALFLLLFSVYLLTFSGVYHASDEISMLAATDSLARRGAWDIELIHWMGEQQGAFGPDGHLYSRKGLGTTLAALPPYWLALRSSHLGNVQAAMLTNSVIHALTAVVIFWFLRSRRLGFGPAVALATALAYGLATMAWPYARYLFSESLAGIGFILSAHFLVCFRTGSPATPQEGEDGNVATWRYPLVAGAGLSLALLARWGNAVVAPVLGLLLLAYLYQLHGRNWQAWIGPILLFGLPVLVSIGIAGWYNWVRFGNALITGYAPEERFATPFLEGLYGLTFSPGKGLFWYNPLLLAALVAWPAFFRQHKTEALLVAAVVAVNLGVYAPWYLWWAGHGWGPRFLVATVPFSVLPLAAAVEAATGRSSLRSGTYAPTPQGHRRVVALALSGLALVSVAVQALGVAVDFNVYLEDVYAKLGLYHPATLFDPAYSPLLRQLAYLRVEHLDLAWARGGALDWVALSIGVGLVLASGLALWAAWRGRFPVWSRVGLLGMLAGGTVMSLVRYAPVGDMAWASQNLASMERRGDAAALTDPMLTESFQDAYDGQQWVWGVPTKEQVEAGQTATWVLGPGDPEPAAARFQIGSIRLDFYPLLGGEFSLSRLSIPVSQETEILEESVELVAAELGQNARVDQGQAEVQAGQALPLYLLWRAVTPMDRSYTIFVQAVDLSTGQAVKAGQLDRLPCNGNCPTTTWRAGDLVGEWVELPIHADALPGPYQLITGMYNLATGERLSTPNGQEYVLIGTVEVQP